MIVFFSQYSAFTQRLLIVVESLIKQQKQGSNKKKIHLIPNTATKLREVYAFTPNCKFSSIVGYQRKITVQSLASSLSLIDLRHCKRSRCCFLCFQRSSSSAGEQKWCYSVLNKITRECHKLI